MAITDQLNAAGMGIIPASNVSIIDGGEYYTSTNVEGALQEVGSDLVSMDANIQALLAENNVQQIDTIAALRTTPVSVTTVYVSGYYATGDGGGGFFKGVTGASAGTYTDDGGMVIVPTGGSGSSAWIRDGFDTSSGLYKGAINVKWLGVKADGTTDNASLINSIILKYSNYTFKTAAWESSINATAIQCNAITLYFPAGIYRIASKIRLSPSIRIFGDGHGNTFQARNQPSTTVSFPRLATVFKVDYANTTDYAFDTSPYNSSGARVDNAIGAGDNTYTWADGVTIANVFFKHTSSTPSTQCKCLNLAACPEFRLENVEITDFIVGARITGSWGGQSNNVRMLNITWKGFITASNTCLTFTNCFLTGTGTTNKYAPATYGYDGTEITPSDAWTQADHNTKTCGLYSGINANHTSHGFVIESFDVAFSISGTASYNYGVYVETINNRVIQMNGSGTPVPEGGSGISMPYFDFSFVNTTSGAGNVLWSQYGPVHIRFNGSYPYFSKLIEYFDTLGQYWRRPIIEGLYFAASSDPVSTNSQPFGLQNQMVWNSDALTAKTADFTVAQNQNNFVVNKSSTCTVTLPAASKWWGREITIRTIAAYTVVSASSNVVPLAGGSASTAILAATAGKWAKLVSDGTNWNIVAAN